MIPRAYIDLVAVLKRRRRERHMSRRTLAGIVGVHPRTLERWEHNHCWPPAPVVWAWAEALGVRLTAADVSCPTLEEIRAVEGRVSPPRAIEGVAI